MMTGGCAHRAGYAPGACVLFPKRAATGGAATAAFAPAPDLWALKPHWIYQAVTSVQPAGDHFTVWYHNVEPSMERISVERDPRGQLILTSEGGWWGGLGAGPSSVTPAPPEAAELARDLEAELRRRCPGERAWAVQYAGRTRTVNVERFVAQDVRRRGPTRFGWIARSTLSMDEGLTRVIGTSESMTGLGLIDLPAGSAWVARAVADAGLHRPFIDPTDPLLLEAARRFGTSESPVDPATLVPSDARLFPPGYVSRVVLKVMVGGTGARLPLDVHDAVLGSGATAQTSVAVGRAGGKVLLSARLAPTVTRAPSPGLAIVPYEGMLTVRVENDHGRSWDRGYIARGEVATDGELVVAPTGFNLPGASCPSFDCDALSGVIPSDGPAGRIQVRVDPGVSDDRH